jgi:hypothetical protein
LKQLSSLLKIPVSLLFIFLHLSALGDNPYRLAAGAGEAGMGNLYISENGFWSAFHNQALLSENKSVSFGVNYNNRFSIKELGTRSVGMIVPAGKTSLAAVYSNFGYSDFNRVMTGIACGMKLSEKISAGVQVDYFREKSSGEYYKNQSVTFEAGILITPSDKIRIGMHFFNPFPSSLRKNLMPASLSVSAGSVLSEVLIAGIEAEMSSGEKLILRTGFDYEAVKNLRLRGGYITNNNCFSFGLGYLIKTVQIDVAFTTHERLGISSSFSFVFKIN